MAREDDTMAAGVLGCRVLVMMTRRWVVMAGTRPKETKRALQELPPRRVGMMFSNIIGSIPGTWDIILRTPANAVLTRATANALLVITRIPILKRSKIQVSGLCLPRTWMPDFLTMARNPAEQSAAGMDWIPLEVRVPSRGFCRVSVAIRDRLRYDIEL